MGTSFACECAKCGLSGRVSAGPDIGFHVKTQTGFCRKCDTLVDYVKEIWSDPGGREITINACESCGNKELIDWNEGSPCPRCGGVLKKGSAVMDWD